MDLGKGIRRAWELVFGRRCGRDSRIKSILSRTQMTRMALQAKRKRKMTVMKLKLRFMTCSLVV